MSLISNFIKNFWPQKEQGGLTSYWYPVLFAGKNSSGFVVNDQTALSINAVYACVRLLSTVVASLPIELYKRTSQGVEQVLDMPESWVFQYRPSPIYNRYTFISTLQTLIMLRGNAVAIIHRNTDGDLDRFEIVMPENWVILKKAGQIYYECVTESGKKHVYHSDEVLHFFTISKDGIIGINPIQAAAEDLGPIMAARALTGHQYQTGTHSNGVIETEKRLSNDQIRYIQETWNSIAAGYQNEGQIPVLQDGMKYKSISLTPNDVRFIEASKMTVSQIARLYGIPPHKIGDLERATFSNIESQAIEFVTDLLRPLCKMYEAELDCKLIPANQRGKLFYRFNLEAILRGDSKSRSDFYSKLFSIGVLSINEIRAIEGLNPIEGGNRHFVPLNMADAANNTAEDGQSNDDSSQPTGGAAGN